MTKKVKLIIIFVTVVLIVLTATIFLKMRYRREVGESSILTDVSIKRSLQPRTAEESSGAVASAAIARYKGVPRWTTPLVSAAGNGDLEAVKALIAEGVNVNQKPAGMGGCTALIMAGENMQIVDYLLEHGANPNVKDDHGETALVYAIGLGNTNLMLKLIAKGADVNARNKGGNIALGCARAGRYPFVVELLKQAGAKE